MQILISFVTPIQINAKNTTIKYEYLLNNMKTVEKCFELRLPNEGRKGKKYDGENLKLFS